MRFDSDLNWMPRSYVARDCNAHVGHEVQDANPGPDAFLAWDGFRAVSGDWPLTPRLPGSGGSPFAERSRTCSRPACTKKAAKRGNSQSIQVSRERGSEGAREGERPLQREAGQEAEDAHGGHRHPKPQRDGSCKERGGFKRCCSKRRAWQ